MRKVRRPSATVLLGCFMVLALALFAAAPASAGYQCGCDNGYGWCVYWDDETGEYTGYAEFQC